MALKLHAIHPEFPRAICSSRWIGGPVRGTTERAQVNCEKCLAKLTKLEAKKAGNPNK